METRNTINLTDNKSLYGAQQRILTELIERCAHQDSQSFARLYRVAAPKLYATAWQILQRESCAEDALQEGFLKIWLYAERYCPEQGTPMAWMTSIVRNQSLTMLKKINHSRFDCGIELDDEPSDAHDPLIHTEHRVAIEQLSRSLAQLNESHRTCVVHIYGQGYTPTEVAQRQRRSVNTIKTWTRRGLQALRNHYTQSLQSPMAYEKN